MLGGNFTAYVLYALFMFMEIVDNQNATKSFKVSKIFGNQCKINEHQNPIDFDYVMCYL